MKYENKICLRQRKNNNKSTDCVDPYTAQIKPKMQHNVRKLEYSNNTNKQY